MCIIAHCTKTRLTAPLLRRMIQDNRDGIGIAWNEKGAVHWKKGIQSVRKAMRILKKLPLPYVVHARFATVGDGPALTHPFPIELFPSEGLEGIAQKVLFHNGHVGEWRALYHTAHGIALPFPDRWSDSRALASVVAHSGENVLDFLPSNRFLIMDGKKIRKWGHWIEEHGIQWSVRLPVAETRSTHPADIMARHRAGEFSSNRFEELDWDRIDNWERYSEPMTEQGDD